MKSRREMLSARGWLWKPNEEKGIDDWIKKYPDEICSTPNSSIGYFQRCPKCEVNRQTTCSACGCGSCCYCGYRFSCMPPLTLGDETKILGTVKVEGIERSMYAGPMRIPDSAGLLFEDDGTLLDKIREVLRSYEYVIVRRKNNDNL